MKTIKDLSSDRLLRERKKAARIAFSEMKKQAIEINEELPVQITIPDQFMEMDAIPEFDTYIIAGIDHGQL